MKCLKCGNESGKNKFCIGCRNIKRNAQAIVSQNKSKLRRLLNAHEFTPAWFEKFMIYTENIKDYGGILMEFKEVDIRNKFEILMKFGIGLSCCFSLLFIFEILIIEL